MRNTRLLNESDEILTVWRRRLERGYPTPTRERDEHVDFLLEKLEKSAIVSRGRFGAWRYEVANQDHSCMQGVEAADRALFGAAELTCWYPELVNAGKHRNQRLGKKGAFGQEATPAFNESAGRQNERPSTDARPPTPNSFCGDLK
jgi:hypothetical protein